MDAQAGGPLSAVIKAMWLLSENMPRACAGSCSNGDLDLCAYCVGTRAGGKQPEAGLELAMCVDAQAGGVLLAALRQWLDSAAFGLAEHLCEQLPRASLCWQAAAFNSQQLHLGAQAGDSGECCTIRTHKLGLCAAPCKQSSAQSVLKVQQVGRTLQQTRACPSPARHQTRV